MKRTITMTLEALKNEFPDFAKDIKLNLSNILRMTELSEQQLWGTILASAMASKNDKLIVTVKEEAKTHLSDEAYNGAMAAFSLMSMNNIYYRFIHLASEKDYATMPAKLRMNVLANPGVEKLDFELFSLAVSAINGCGMCMDAHEQSIRKLGGSKDLIQNTIRVASIIHAVGQTLQAAA